MRNGNSWIGTTLPAVLLSAGLCRSSARAADVLVVDAGSWAQIVAEGSLKFLDPSLEKGRLWLEGQSRWDDNWNHWYQGLARAALGYSLSERATVWLSYTFVPTQNLGQPYVGEQDVWPAFRYVLPTGFGTFTFRTMLESNFIKGDQVRERPRQLIRHSYPLSAEPRLTLVLWDEVFVRLNTTTYGGQAGFDQNRGLAGFGWTFNPTVRAELGYMNQYIDNRSHTAETMHKLIMGSLFINF